jgi:hypothetical protein
MLAGRNSYSDVRSRRRSGRRSMGLLLLVLIGCLALEMGGRSRWLLESYCRESAV